MVADVASVPLPIPKPRTFSGKFIRTIDGRIVPKKTPVPLPRVSLISRAKGSPKEVVKLRSNIIRRESQKPIVIEQDNLDGILRIRPNSYPSVKHIYDEPFGNLIPAEDDNHEHFMSARAIAAARTRNERPASAYVTSEQTDADMNRRRASLAIMPICELQERDRIIMGSCGTSHERQFSPDFGAIRVQVEDITTLPSSFMDHTRKGESFDEAGETSSETISELNNTGVELRKFEESETMHGRVADWAVPVEYASSPIAVELTQSSADERPPPPIPAVYMNTSGIQEESAYSDSVFRRNSSTSSVISTSMGKHVTLLEQIIRTHAIWYLPHLGRPEVLHLLHRMEPGNFIVRASTRESCMALSVRLPAGSKIETDHYIIEKITAGSSNVVRLEGSPLTFRSLPLLIEHYCVNEEELETRLQLPASIRACTTTKELQSIALMEQDFWTSDMSLSRKGSRSVSRSSLGSVSRLNNNTIRCGGSSNDIEQASTWFIDNKSINDNPIYDQVATPKTVCTSGLLTPEMSSNDGSLKITTKKRRSTSSRGSNGGSSRFATVCVGDIAYNRNVLKPIDVPMMRDETDSRVGSHSPQTVENGKYELGISRSDRRTQSVRSQKSVNSPSKPAISSSQTLSRPRSFLRSLLSFGNKDHHVSSKPQISKDERALTGPQNLADCEYFTPCYQSQVRTSRSAFDITRPPNRGFFGTGTSARKKSGRAEDDGARTIWRDEMTAVGKVSPGARSNTNGMVLSESMKTFKPAEGETASPNSSRSRPLSIRRERSDFNGTTFGIIKSNAKRLAHHNESSPGPANTGGGRIPMTPPSNANDPQVIKNCVEELRRKRLQSANEMLSPVEKEISAMPRSAHASPQISMRRRNGFPSPSTSSTTSSSSFNRHGFAGIDRHRGAEHRLSVPNLIAATEPMVPGCVGHTAKALKERLGRTNDAGELTVINEGLVTPVVRRKNFAAAPTTTTNRRSTAQVAEVEGVSVAAGEVAKRREALEALIDKRKQQKALQIDSMSSGSASSSSSSSSSSEQPTANTRGNSTAESELIWRRAKNSSKSTPHTWSTINYELKNRQQKIAKVLPQPQLNRHMIGEQRRSSDYAQICDYSALDAAHHSSKIDDDAVSVAGTVFNEPWDSNVWENLLDLAHHGDENTTNKVEPIQEEDSDSDRTAGGDGSTCQMESEEEDDDDEEEEEEEEELRWPSESSRRPLPSDRVTVKAWEHPNSDTGSTKYSTLDSRKDCSLKRNGGGSFSMRSLPRALSRFSNAIGMHSAAASFGSIDDLPTTIPSMSPLLGGGRGASRKDRRSPSSADERIGRAVQEYVEELAQVHEGVNACFGMTLRQFIACTKDTKESDPSVVVRNVRQFINGMKNYLVKHGEGDLHRIIDEESARLNSNQILNIDAVLEAVLHKLLLREVKPLLYHVMVKEHSKSGTLQMISSNIGIVRKMNLSQLGFANPQNLVVPSQNTLEQVKLLMRKMQSHYSPMKKLENLMKAVSLVVCCQEKVEEGENADPAMLRGIPAADDLVRWLVYILARTSTVGCEVEAWYMWELLPQPILMQSDASYYLTALFSAVHVLKSAEAIRRLCEKDQQVISSVDISPRHCCSSPLLSTATLTRGNSSAMAASSTACDAFVKIAVPDETVGCVRYTTFPGVPLLTTSKLSRLIAHQQGITNPEEHGLYLIADGFESCLQPADCPVVIHEQLKKESKPHLFAYKRHEAKIAWPRAAISAC